LKYIPLPLIVNSLGLVVPVWTAPWFIIVLPVAGKL
jgi:hypothetical protein